METSRLCLSIHLLGSQRIPHSVLRPTLYMVLKQRTTGEGLKDTKRIYTGISCFMPMHMKRVNSGLELASSYRTFEESSMLRYVMPFQDEDKHDAFPSLFDHRSF